MSNLEKVVRLAAQHHGVFATFQLPEIGLSRGSIDTVVKNAMFTRICRGLYSLNGCEISWHHQAMVSVLRSGPDALLSHESALVNMKLLSEDFFSRRKGETIPFHVTLPRESRRRLTSSIHRSIYKADVLTRIYLNAIPQVPIEHAIIESVRHMPEQMCSSVVDSAIRRKLTNPKKLQVAMAQLWPAPGRSKSRVEKIVGGYLLHSKELARVESVLEARVLRIVSQCTNIGIRSQYQVFANGRRYRIDLAIPEHKIAIEVDGYLFHRGRESFDADKVRQNDLMASGWRVLRFTATQSDEEIRTQTTRLLSVLCDGAFKHVESMFKRPIA